MTDEFTDAVQIELSADDVEAIARLKKLEEEYVTFAKPDHFEGDVGRGLKNSRAAGQPQ